MALVCIEYGALSDKRISKRLAPIRSTRLAETRRATDFVRIRTSIGLVR